MLSINELYTMPCDVFLKHIDTASVDLAVLDPPYNMSKEKWDTFSSEGAFFEWTFGWLSEVIRTLKETGSLYVFNTPYNSAFILAHIVRQGLCFQNWITWDKRDGHTAGKNRFATKSETVLFFTKSEEYTFNYEDIRVPYNSVERLFGKNRYARQTGIVCYRNGKQTRWFPNEDGALCSDVWHYSSARNRVDGKLYKQYHISPKPVEMVERIIKASSNPGDLVLDCFMGSGTTAVAAKNLGRNFIGADNDPHYVSFAKDRLAKTFLSPKVVHLELFDK